MVLPGVWPKLPVRIFAADSNSVVMIVPRQEMPQALPFISTDFVNKLISQFPLHTWLIT